MANHFHVPGSVALVTGSSRGLGKALVQGLLEAGAARVYAGVRGDPGESCWANKERVTPLEISIENVEQVRAAAERAPDVQLLINNAGLEMRAPFLSEPTTEAAHREMEVNYFGPLNMCRAFIGSIRRRRGAIVNILSLAALANMPAVGSYSASKAAARSMTQGLRAELQAEGLPVYAVYPGTYDTDMAVGFVGDRNPPSLLVAAVIEALENGYPLEIFPDETGKGMERLLLEDPRELERQCGLYLPDDSFGRVGRGREGGRAGTGVS